MLLQQEFYHFICAKANVKCCLRGALVPFVDGLRQSLLLTTHRTNFVFSLHCYELTFSLEFHVSCELARDVYRKKDCL